MQGKWEEYQHSRFRSNTCDDDLDEGVRASLSHNANFMKGHCSKLRFGGSFSPGLSLDVLPDTVLTKQAQSLRIPMRGDHNLSLPNTDRKHKTKSNLDIESSEDSSYDDMNAEEEQKRVEEDSYLFIKHKAHKEHDKPMNGSLFKLANELQMTEGNYPQRGRNSLEVSRKRPLSEARHGPGMEQPVSELLKMNSDPDIEDPGLEPASLEEVDKSVVKPEEKIDLEISQHSQHNSQLHPSGHELLLQKSETNKSDSRKAIDTKQESNLSRHFQ